MTKSRDLHGQVTPPAVYFNRRAIMKGAVLATSMAATTSVYRWFNPSTEMSNDAAQLDGFQPPDESRDVRRQRGFDVDEPPTSESKIVNYNNFYEFTTDKEAVAAMSQNFRTDGWKLQVGGLVERPKTYTLGDLAALGPYEERIYRMRCVEAWSMVIPWAGLPLERLLEDVRPTSKAKYVAFTTLLDPDRMPGQKTDVLQWPYVEGLRLDEAMHPLTLLATGLYRKQLPPQDGAPIRLVVPWKYGFKGIKSIVRIDLVESEPPTSWNRYAPGEYGFYANVNPMVDHPRWSQATEQRIGEVGRRETLMFNGYQSQVASLYAGMDLRKFY